MDTLIINLPFEGFYDSKYSGEFDSIQEREAEHFAEYQDEEGIAPELRLDASEFSEILLDATDWAEAYRMGSKVFVDAFNDIASEHLDLPLRLSWESMSSPREYNFATDRVFAHIPVDVVQALFARSAAEEHKRLAECIAKRFTSYDGFSSHYPNQLATWLERDVTDWDHNELGTLLIALLSDYGDEHGETLDWDVYYRCVDGDGFYHEYSEATDWKRFEELVSDKRAEKLEELRLDDPEHPLCVMPEPPYRCPNTIDMFSGQAG